MSIKLHKIAAGFALLSFCSGALAVTDQPITGTFKTIKEVSVTQVVGEEMIFNGLQPASGSICTMAQPSNLTTAWPGETKMKLSNTAGTSTLGAGSTNGAMSGTGCSTSTPGVPGIYEIDGAEGANVTIDVPGTAFIGGIKYEATGCAGDYNAAADGDNCTAFTFASSQTVKLASVSDETVSAGQGQPESGISRIALGGTVTSNIGLTAAQAYSLDFEINVVY
jgi:hypothetical protein